MKQGRREREKKAKVIIRHWQLRTAAALLMVSVARRTYMHVTKYDNAAERVNENNSYS